MQAAGAQGGAIMNVNTTDNRTGRRLMAAINPMTGGAGGRAAARTAQTAQAPTQGFLKNTPIEINEAEVPIRFHRYGLKRDSGGPGLHRGGLATEMTFEVFAPNTRVTARNRDRTIFQGWGIQGRPAGRQFVFHPEPRQRTARPTCANTDILKIGPGDVIYVVCRVGLVAGAIRFGANLPSGATRCAPRDFVSPGAGQIRLRGRDRMRTGRSIGDRGTAGKAAPVAAARRL